MRSLASRLARLERTVAGCTGQRRIVLHYGYLKTLPPEYAGPRHVVTVKQLPRDVEGHDWFEWEERPGPEPVAEASNSDDLVIRVYYVEENPLPPPLPDASRFEKLR